MAHVTRGLAAAVFAAGLALPGPVHSMSDAEARDLARELLAEMVAVRSVDGLGTTEGLVRTLADRFRAAGFPRDDVQVLMGPKPDIGNLLIRLEGRAGGRKPILLLAHIDVVDALREDWTYDPFALTEVGDRFVGRGVADNKAGAAHLATTLLRFKEEGFVPDRDLIMILTGDEETNGDGIDWIIREHPQAKEAEYALNSDSGGGALKGGAGFSYGLQTSEKMYLTFILEVRNPGGHSSRPRRDNAIYRLARALGRIGEHRFPVRFNETTKNLFAELAKLERGARARQIRSLASRQPRKRAIRDLSRDPWYNAMLRTTCVATRLDAGHADNALPQTARATVNCRIFPGVPAAEVEAELNRIVDDPEVKIIRDGEPVPSQPSPLRPDILEAVERAVEARYPGIPVLPIMSTGATDGLYVRNAGIPTYGVNGLFGDLKGSNAHGMNEHILIDEFYDGLEHWRILLTALAGQAPERD